VNHSNSGLLLLTALPGILALISGIYLKYFSHAYPDTRIGYKTDLTIKNAQTWKEANSFSGKVFIGVGIFNLVLWPLASYIFREWPSLAIMSYLLFIVLSMCILISTTEKHLNKVFDRNGNRKMA
jgi:uncharacterized membrane protein